MTGHDERQRLKVALTKVVTAWDTKELAEEVRKATDLLSDIEGLDPTPIEVRCCVCWSERFGGPESGTATGAPVVLYAKGWESKTERSGVDLWMCPDCFGKE